jgi:hypothetical protein
LKEGFDPKPIPNIKTLKNMLLMQEQPRLLSNDDVQTCEDQNKLKNEA